MKTVDQMNEKNDNKKSVEEVKGRIREEQKELSDEKLDKISGGVIVANIR